MGSLLVLIAVAFIVFTWMRVTRRTREKWLRQLNLSGIWDLDSDDRRQMSLEFTGTLSSGRYTARTDGGVESGTWRLVGHNLVLEPGQGASADYDLRLFDTGKIGIDGPGRQRQIYLKRADNVVPLRVIQDPEQSS